MMSQEDRTAFEKRRRARNWAIFLTAIALAVLFFFIAMARFPRSALG
jgi:hypothetical protein